ncbi:MFS transporter, partial [Xanthomonas euvesicatoria]
LASILGAAPAPYVATQLAASYGVQSVGYYLGGAAVLSLMALVVARRWRR